MGTVSYIEPSKELQDVVPIDLSLFDNQERRFDDWGSHFNIVKEADGCFRLRLDILGGCSNRDPDKDELLTGIRDNTWSEIIGRPHVDHYKDNQTIDYQWMSLVFHKSELIAITQGPIVFWTKYKSWPIWKLRKFIDREVKEAFTYSGKPTRYARKSDFKAYPLGKKIVHKPIDFEKLEQEFTYTERYAPALTKFMDILKVGRPGEVM